MLVYAPLLKWYIAHGAEITAIDRTIDYEPGKIFIWLLEQVTEARRTGDVEQVRHCSLRSSSCSEIARTEK